MNFDGPKRFPYMPPRSYAIHPDGRVFFLKELPEELKKRFLADVEASKKKEETKPFDPMAFE